MKLTKAKAIAISIELWKWLAETGSMVKSGWPGWVEYGSMYADCALCYSTIRNGCDASCTRCTYFAKFGNCCEAGTPYYRWSRVFTKRTRIKYAKLFLAQLKEL